MKSGIFATLVTRIAIIAGCLVLCSSIFPRAVFAGAFYYEAAGGLGKSAVESASGLGLSVNNALLVSFGGTRRAFTLQLGVQHRLSSASDAAYSYGFQTVYPVIRLQMSRVYLSLGYTPFVWKRVSTESGFDNFSRARSTTATLGELGILWPVTRKFSFITAGGAQMIRGDGPQSSKPSWDATVGMRIYFGFFGPAVGERSSGEFHGWRYPFGMIR